MVKLNKHWHTLFSTFSEITGLMSGSTDKQLIFKRLLEGALVALEAERVYLLELDEDKIFRYSKSRSSPPGEPMHIDELSGTPVLRHWMIRESQERTQLRAGHELAIDLSSLVSGYIDASTEGHRVIISSPLVAKTSVFGLLVAIHASDGGGYEPQDAQIIAALANQAAIVLENRLLYEKLEREAVTDGLTGVYNYRFLIGSLEREMKRARRFKQSFSFAMIDVDNLKSYNDRLGHLSGSQALKEVAHILKERCREIDLVTKYGGDEFGIILPRTELDGAVVVTERIRQAVREHAFDGRTKGLLTCSAGISCFPNDGQTVREIIASADRALYEAKRSSRNTVFTTNDLVHEPQR